jgi:hypothetical protein
MTLFNLVHSLSRQDGHVGSRRWRSLNRIGLFALLLQLPHPAFAQSPDWGQWQEPSKNSDKGIPPGVAYPGGQPLCEGMELAGRHAYWRCMPGCPGVDVINQYCWQGVSDAIYTCPAPAKGFRRMEKIRYTKEHCGPKDWATTKHLADLYGETWQNGIADPPEVTAQLPPTTDEELPKTADGSSIPWDPSGPPWVPKEAEKTDTPPDGGKTDTGKLDTPKTDTPKTDTAKTDTGQTATDKKVTGGSGTTTPSNTKKSAPRKEVRNKSGGRTVDRSRGGNDIDQGGLSPEAATAIGIGIGMGLGAGFGRGHMGGDRMGGDRGRMMDR